MDKKFSINFISFSIVTNIIFLNWCHGLDTSTIKPISDEYLRRQLNLKVEDNLPKPIDPPPEYYRGPGSFSSLSSSSSSQSPDRDRNRDRNPDSSNVIGLQRPPYGFETRYPPKGGSTSPRPNIHERIGHYGSTSSEYTGSSYGSIGDHIPYGPPQSIDFPSSYGQTSYGIYDHGYDLDHKGYVDYDSHSYYPPPPKGPMSNYYEEKLRFTKSFLLPIAGAAIIGLAAALITNPVLLHLGTVGTNVLGRRRKRRSLNDNHHYYRGNSNENERDAHRLAYRATAYYVSSRNNLK